MKLLKFKKQNQNGASMIELILYVGLLAVILTVVYQIFTLVAVGKVRQLSNDQIYLSAQRIIDDISYEIKNANSITSPIKGTPGDLLNLDDGSIIYQIVDQKVQKQIGTEQYFLSEQSVAVNTISFTLLGDYATQSSVLINLTIEGTAVSGKSSVENFQTAVSTR